jgi:hypothetical protein
MNKIISIVAVCLVMLSSCDRQCKKTECVNGGTCYEGECICEKWYSGDQCELFYNRNFDGVFVGSYGTGNSLLPRRLDSIIVVADATIPNRLNIQNSFYYELVSDSSLIIPTQTVYSADHVIRIEGTGKYKTDWIRLEYFQTSSDANGENTQTIIFSGSKE